MVWYVDSALGTNGNGESNSPFNNLASVNSASTNNGDVIFLFGGSSQKTYSGNLTLQAEPGAHRPARRPQRQQRDAPAGLGRQPDHQGLERHRRHDRQRHRHQERRRGPERGRRHRNLRHRPSPTSRSAGTADTADNGINLSGAASGTISIFGTHRLRRRATPCRSRNRSGGTVSFYGSVNDTGSGVSLTNNTGATIGFTGGLTVATTGSNPAFTATGGGDRQGDRQRQHAECSQRHGSRRREHHDRRLWADVPVDLVREHGRPRARDLPERHRHRED